MNEYEFEGLVQKSEGRDVDFKAEQYRLDNESLQSFLIKDILSMANTLHVDTAYIIIGIKAYPDGSKEFLGISNHYDDAQLQSLIKDKVDRVPIFNYFPFNYKGKSYGIIKIPGNKTKPFRANRDFGVLRKHAVYIRRGSMNDEARADEIDSIYEESLSFKTHSKPIVIEEVNNKPLELAETYVGECVEWSFKSEWTQLVNENLFTTSIYGDTVYIGLHDKAVGLNLDSGQVVWKSLTNNFAGSPVRLHNTIVVPCYNTLFCWDAAESKKNYHRFNANWRLDHGSNYVHFKAETQMGFVGTHRSGTKPGYPSNTSFPLRGLAGVDLTNGRVVWRFDTQDEGCSFPVLTDSTVVYFATDRNIYALNQSNGELIWSVKTGTSPSGNIFPLAANAELVATGSWDPMNPEYYQLHCIDALSGKELRRFEIVSDSGTCIVRSICLNDRTLICGTWDGHILAWDIESGQKVWETSTIYPYPIFSIQENKLVVGYRGGVVLLSLEGGIETGHIRAKRPEYVSLPLLHQGRIIVSCTDGYVYALRI